MLVQDTTRLVLLFKEIIICIQRGVAEVLPHIAMERIGPGLGYNINICACVPAVGRIVLSRLHLEFLNRIRIGHRDTATGAPGTHKIVNM